MFKDLVSFEYKDDMITEGSTLSKHNQNVHKVLARLQSSGAHASFQKCKFGVKSLILLGYDIYQGGFLYKVTWTRSVWFFLRRLIIQRFEG